MIKKVLFALTALAAAAGAQAAIVSFEYGIPLSLTTTEITETNQLGLFDSGLGTLTGASIEVFGEAEFAFSGTNNSASPQNAIITSSTTLSWSTTLGALSSFLTDAIELSETSGLQNYTAGQFRLFGPINQASSNSDDLTSILSALQLAGGGNFDVTCGSLSGLAVRGGGGNIATTQATRAGCGARIVYTYDEVTSSVPEPASIALVSLALAGAGVATRRRKRV